MASKWGVKVDSKKLMEHLNKIPDNMEELLGKTLYNVMDKVMEESNANANVDLGDGKGSNYTTLPVKQGNMTIVEGGYEAKHMIYVHEGTAPHWTSVENLQGWADRHGVNVYALQASIAKNGTKAYKFLENAVDRHAGDIDKAIADYIKANMGDLTK